LHFHHWPSEIYKRRWAGERFFRWISPHLRFKAFHGTSENAVKTQARVAV
jgi:IS4 transposase